MNTRTLAVIGVAGLAVVGFAIFYVGGGREPRSRRAASAASDRDENEPPRKAAPKKPPKSAPTITPRDEPYEGDEEEGPPEPTLEEARDAFDDYIAGLDREIERVEKSGVQPTQEEWIKHRSRAAEVIDGVLRKLDHKDPNMITELQDKQKEVKARLDRLSPAPP